MGRKYLKVLGGFLICICLVFIFRESILSAYARWFEVSNAEKGADAIICLSGGKLTRVPESIRLWKDGYAKKIFLTEQKSINGRYNHLLSTNLLFAQEVAKEMKMKVPWEILPSQDGGATSTFDEAADALFYAQKKNWKRLIIVTDYFHTRRALYAFEKVLKDSDIIVQVAGVGNDIFNSQDWWKSDRGIMTYFSETIKFPIYLFWDAEPNLVSNH